MLKHTAYGSERSSGHVSRLLSAYMLFYFTSNHHSKYTHDS